MGARRVSDMVAEGASVLSAEWHLDARCSKHPLRPWFSADVLTPSVGKALSAVCARCPVFDQCAEWRDEFRPRAAFWAGRFMGKRIPDELRDNPPGCPVVMVTAPRRTQAFLDVCASLPFALVMPPGEQPYVPLALQVLVVDSNTVDESELMAVSSPNEVVALGDADLSSFPLTVDSVDEIEDLWEECRVR